MAEIDEKWYYSLSTGEVVQGKKINAADRMGPYDSENEAKHALEIAHQRAKEADSWDEKDDNWGES